MQRNIGNKCQRVAKFGDRFKSGVSFRWVFWTTIAISLTVTLNPGMYLASESTSPADEATQPVLKVGSKGTAVSKLQAGLKLLGYYTGEVDGVYGKTTAESVAKFQQAAGLTPDGITGETTWKRLFPTNAIASTPKSSPTPKPSPTPKSSPSPTPQPSPSPTPKSQSIPTPDPDVSLPTLRLGMSGEAVSGLQQRLKALGLFPDKIDGVFGAKTESAVKKVQIKFKIEPDGIVGKSTWEALLR